jgi:hypothetical protein
LPSRPADVSPDLARVDAGAGGVHVKLWRADATLVGEKTLVAAASCAEMAEAIGVVLAMWELPLHPGLAPTVEPTAPAEAIVTPAATLAAVAPTAATATDRFRLETGVGVRAVLPGPVPGLLIDVAVRHRARGWGGRVLFGGAWWHETLLAGGQVSWARVTGGLGLIHGWQGDRWFADVQAQGMAAVLVAQGRGYDETRTPVALEPGAGIGLRGGVVVGGVARVWAELGVAWWPMRRSLRVGGFDPVMVDVARFEPALTIGGSFLTGR